MSEALKPCPFMGCKVELDNDGEDVIHSDSADIECPLWIEEIPLAAWNHRADTTDMAALRKVREEMAQAEEVTVRHNAETYPPNERKTLLDWVAVRSEVKSWLTAIDEIMEGGDRPAK